MILAPGYQIVSLNVPKEVTSLAKKREKAGELMRLFSTSPEQNTMGNFELGQNARNAQKNRTEQIGAEQTGQNMTQASARPLQGVGLALVFIGCFCLEFFLPRLYECLGVNPPPPSLSLSLSLSVVASNCVLHSSLH